MNIKLVPGTVKDAFAIAALRTRVAEHLTLTHGSGHWSSATSEKGVLYAIRNSKLFVARDGSRIIATLQLVTKKSWAIDVSYFTACKRPLYLVGMAVEPDRQGQGIGRGCLEQVRQIAMDWPAEAIRLDAYDAPAGAGEFYARCGYREVGRKSYRNVPLIYLEMML